MRKSSIVLSLFLLAGIVLFTGCEEEKKKEFKLVSLLTDLGVDLAGATQATDVPEDALIIATFSSNVDPITVNTTSFKITNADAELQDYTLAVVGPVITATPTEGWDAGSQITIELTAAIEGNNGVAYTGNTLGFRTGGIFVPNKEYMVLHLSFDDQTTADETGNHTVTTVGTMTWATDRHSTTNSAAYFDGEGNLVEVAAAADLISADITISFWMNTSLADYDGADASGLPQMRRPFGLGAELGYFMEMGRRSKDHAADGYNEIFMKVGTDHVNVGANAATVPKATAWSELNSQINVNFETDVQNGWSYSIDELKNTNDPLNRDYIRNIVMDHWIHFVMTVNATSQEKTFYINGVKWATQKWNGSGSGLNYCFTDLSLKTEDNTGTPYAGLEGSLALGSACSSTSTQTGWADYQTQLAATAETKKFFKGAIDDFRIFSVAFTDTEVATLYDNEQ